MVGQGQAFAATQLVQPFPACVWRHDLKPQDHEAINRRILLAIGDLIKRREAPERSPIWQTHHDLHRLDKFGDLAAVARKAAQGAFNHLQIDHTDFQITSRWANLNPQQTRHSPHTHPNNYLSGVYYVQVPDASDGLVLHDPRAQALVISPKVKKLAPLTSGEASLPVREGRLFIFPSWLGHSAAKTRAEGDRISVSFNFMLSSLAKEFGPPRWSKRR